MNSPALKFLSLLALILCPLTAEAQQRSDPDFDPSVANSQWPSGEGPRVSIDQAHVNFHTLEGRYAPFATLLAKDGYRVSAGTAPFTSRSLDETDILVIANALHPRNEIAWALPTYTAFTPTEVEAVRAWVANGGSLLLIADHMPFAGAARTMAAAFEIRFFDGFAVKPGPQTPLTFSKVDGSLRDHVVTSGIDSIVTFTGQAFQVDGEVTPLMTLPDNYILLMPSTAWQFRQSTPRLNVTGWLQGAALEFRKGRVAVFGEAAMFSAQVSGPDAIPAGMNAPGAEQNAQFLLNVMRWLSKD